MIERERLSETVLPAHERVYRTLAGADHARAGGAGGGADVARASRAEFGVSMTPAREAVRRLVAEGALKLWPRGGCRRRSSPTSGSRSWRRSGR